LFLLLLALNIAAAVAPVDYDNNTGNAGRNDGGKSEILNTVWSENLKEFISFPLHR
jgi:hypothetical protein